MCEGHCDSWLHRKCAGLSFKAFTIVMQSPTAFCFSHCRLEIQGKGNIKPKFISLDSTAGNRWSEDSLVILDCICPSNASPCCRGQATEVFLCPGVVPTDQTSTPGLPQKPHLYTEKKINLIFHGLEESTQKLHFQRVEENTSVLRLMCQLSYNIAPTPYGIALGWAN